jgi:cytochrome P450
MAKLPAGLTGLELTPAGWALAVGVVAFLAYAISSVVAAQRLRHFNGPFVTRFSYLWLLRATGFGAMGERLAEADARYGSTFRVGPNELLTSDPDLLRRTSSARSRYTRSDWYRLVAIDPYEPAMFNTLDTAEHDRLKAQTAPGYAGKDNPGLEGEIDAMLAELVGKIRTKYAAEKPGEVKPHLDMATMAQYFTLDSIAKVAFGQEFGLMREERDLQGHIAMLHEIAPKLTITSIVPWLRAIVGSSFMLRLMGPKPGDKRGVGRMMP